MYGDNVAYNGCFGCYRRCYGGVDMYGVYESRLDKQAVCHCAVCGAPLYENDNVYEVELGEEVEYVCDKCIDDYIDDKQFEINEWFKDYNKVTL